MRLYSMRWAAKRDKKFAPEMDALEEKFHALEDLRCVRCGEIMTLHKREKGASFVVSLQHLGGQEFELICSGCNSAHNLIGEDFNLIPKNHKRCTVCREVLPFEAFYSRKKQSGRPGVRPQCKKCEKQKGTKNVSGNNNANSGDQGDSGGPCFVV
jgi:hypothetical protein